MSDLCPLVRISPAVIDPMEVEKAVWTTTDGAVVTFSGVVRDHDHDREVLDIEYSAHPGAVDVLEQLCEEIAREHTSPTPDGTEQPDPRGVVRVGAVHRVGVLPVGEIAVVVVAAAAHRAEAFAACSEVIERLKARVPIWKRQRFTDGVTEWVGVGDC